jgi:hypothetical protein
MIGSSVKSSTGARMHVATRDTKFSSYTELYVIFSYFVGILLSDPLMPVIFVVSSNRSIE